MWYGKVMNEERDPITEWEHAIERRIGAAAVICMLAVIVGAMVAPIFDRVIKNTLYRTYVLDDNCEQLVNHKMKLIRIGLWALAIVSWIVIISISNSGYCLH